MHRSSERSHSPWHASSTLSTLCRERRERNEAPTTYLALRERTQYAWNSARARGIGMSAPVLSPRIQQLLLELLRELGRPATTDELAQLLRERAGTSKQAE